MSIDNSFDTDIPEGTGLSCFGEDKTEVRTGQEFVFTFLEIFSISLKELENASRFFPSIVIYPKPVLSIYNCAESYLL